MYDERERGTLNQMNRFTNYDFVKLSSKDIHVESVNWVFESVDGIKISTLKNCSLSDRDVVFFLKKCTALCILLLKKAIYLSVIHVDQQSMWIFLDLYLV